MRYSGKTMGLIVAVLVLLSGASGCHLRAPLPPRPYVLLPGETHYAQPHQRVRHHYRYFPASQVYFDTTRNIYFYLSDNIWLSGPLLPNHIRIDLNNFVTMELDEPKPFIYHRDTLKKYPPGLRKEKNRTQRETLLEKREQQKERLQIKTDEKKVQLKEQKERLERREKQLDLRENKLEKRMEIEKREEQRERREIKKDEKRVQLYQQKERLERREKDLELRKNKLEKREENESDPNERGIDLRENQKEKLSGSKKRSPETQQEAGKRKKAKKKKGEEEDEELEEKGRRKAIWK